MSKHVSDSSKCFWSETLLIHINNQIHNSSYLPECDLYTWPKRQQTLELYFCITESMAQFYPSSASLQVDFMCQDLECQNVSLNNRTGVLTHMGPGDFGVCVSSAFNL